MSLDGYIAQPGDDLSFLSIVEKEGEDYGYADFMQTIDTVIVGRRTHDWVKANAPAYAHSERETYVITHAVRPAEGKTTFYNGGLHELIGTLKSKPGKNIFVDGGAQVVNALLKSHLIDEMIVSVIPILVGDGIRLFKDGRPEERLRLRHSKSFDTGLVQLHYTTEYQNVPADQE